jgi:hypothetical protein
VPKYEYQVVPFIGKIRNNQPPGEVSGQLQSLINQCAAQGWEFYELNDVNIEVQPGCLAGLFGAKTAYIQFDQVIFRRERN